MAESKKKVVVGEQTGGAVADPPANWKPTPEAKSKATTFRWIAVVLWVLAIAAEAVGIFWLLRQRVFVGEDGTLVRDPDTGLLEEQGVTATFPQWAFITLLVLLVVIAALAITGSFLWKKANRLDPARRSETVRFFVQNQLGAIIAVIAFLPLIILIFTNKDMDGKQKALAGIIAIVIGGGALALGVDYNPPSVEQYTEESNTIEQLTGQDLVYWTKSGSVFHVCAEVPDVNKESKDGQIYEGTVADAHAAGKDRLVSYWEREAVNYCGYTQEQVDAVANSADTDSEAPVEAPEETPAAE